jgi:hypothetical protein
MVLYTPVLLTKIQHYNYLLLQEYLLSHVKLKIIYILIKKGQFQRCQLAEDLQIRIGNSLEKCPADFWINVSISDAGNQSITCRQY